MGFSIPQPFPAPFAHYKPRSHKVYGVICMSTNHTILLVRGRQTNKWSFPKGHLKGSEMAHECALREFREETGILLEPNRFSKIIKLFAGEYYVYHTTEMDVVPEDNSEICDAGWFTLRDIHAMDIADVNADIKKYMRIAGFRYQ